MNITDNAIIANATENYYGNLKYQKYDDYIEITGCTDKSLSTITIPQAIDGLPVKNIKANAFLECASLFVVKLPPTLVSIGNHAFDGCVRLSSITIPDSVTNIGEHAFARCGENCANGFTIYVYSVNSYAYVYARQWKYNVDFSREPAPVVTTQTETTTTITTTAITTTTTATTATGTGYEQWTMFEDTIVSIEDDKVTFSERGKTAVMNNGYNMEKIKNAGIGSKVSVEALVSPSGSILNIINIEVIEKSDIKLGDANNDNDVNVADAVLIMQALSNPSEYKISEDCLEPADVVNKGDGVTSIDALAIQMIGINLLTVDDFPITTEKLNTLIK